MDMVLSEIYEQYECSILWALMQAWMVILLGIAYILFMLLTIFRIVNAYKEYTLASLNNKGFMQVCSISYFILFFLIGASNIYLLIQIRKR